MVTKSSSVTFTVTKGLATNEDAMPTQPVATHLFNNSVSLIDEGGLYPEAKTTKLLQGMKVKNGFIAAALQAWNSHYPFVIAPQHVWLCILQALAVHVEQNAEELRQKWVSHEGKKTLEVRCDEFTLGKPNDWASVVDGKPDSFSVQINKNVVEGLPKELVPEFSTLTPKENIAIKMTVMDITKSYFDFKCSTRCGFPSVTMDGSESDW